MKFVVCITRTCITYIIDVAFQLEDERACLACRRAVRELLTKMKQPKMRVRNIYLISIFFSYLLSFEVINKVFFLNHWLNLLYSSDKDDRGSHRLLWRIWRWRRPGKLIISESSSFSSFLYYFFFFCEFWNPFCTLQCKQIVYKYAPTVFAKLEKLKSTDLCFMMGMCDEGMAFDNMIY